jgi:hypothetical protein
MSDSPTKKEAAPAKESAGSGEHVEYGTSANDSQEALAGRLLLLRRILLTAVAMIEELIVPVKGGEK